MKVELTAESKNVCDLESQSLETAANEILQKLGLKKPHTTVEVFLVDDEKIREINKQFRHKDSATDVLSFPQHSFSAAKEETLGTIFIAPEFAKQENISCKQLFIHGLLHLLGYDHETNIKNWKNAEKIIGEETL